MYKTELNNLLNLLAKPFIFNHILCGHVMYKTGSYYNILLPSDTYFWKRKTKKESHVSITERGNPRMHCTKMLD